MNIFNTSVIYLTNVSVHQIRHEKWVKKAKARNHHAISLRFGGHARFSFENYEQIDVNKGAICFMPQGVSFTHQQFEPSEIVVIHFNAKELLGCKPFVLNPLDDGDFQHLFNQLCHVWEENPEPSNVNIMAAAYKIFETIIGESETQLAGSRSQIIFEAIKYMRQNFANPKLTIGACADAVGISEIYLRKLFKKKFNDSPSNYLCDLRVKYAKTLLESGYYTVNEVAERSGFSSPAYFCSVFKAHTKLTPLECSKRF